MAKILIADDSRTSRKMLLDIIREFDFDEIYEAVDGNDAVIKFQELLPDIVTLDITMPGKDGIEVLRTIMSQRPETKVIMITAAAQNVKIMEAVKLGAADFISKPYEKSQVEEVLTRLLENKG